MKKQNTLRSLSALTLLLVLAGFLVTCEDGYQPTVRGVSFYQEVGKKKIKVDESNPLAVNIKNGDKDKNYTYLYVKCDIPSGVKDLSLTLTFNKDLLEITDEFTEQEDPEYNKNGVITSVTDDPRAEIKYGVRAKNTLSSPFPTITITVEPGEATATCAVTIDTGGGGVTQTLRLIP